MPAACATAGSSPSGRLSSTSGLLPVAEALSVLLVRAVEENDPDGRVLGLEDRRRATGEVRTPAAPQAAARVIAARARTLVPAIAAQLPALAGAARDVRTPAWVGVGLVAAASLVGVASSALGPSRRINVLSVPILVVLGWNLLVYLTLLASLAVHLPGSAADGAPAPLRRALVWVAERISGLGGTRAGEMSAAARAATAEYLTSWRRVAAPVVIARARALLHLGSAALAAGMIAGMYVRGIAFEYRATWESTFLGPAQVHALLVIVLGPAAAVLGRSVPDAEALALIRAPGSGEAASFIHLFAITAFLWVIAPRLVLAAVEAARARGRARRVVLDLSEPYYGRLLAEYRGDALAVYAVPYCTELDSAAAGALRERLHRLEGKAVTLRVHPPVAYGTEASEWLERALGDPDATSPATSESQRWLALVTSLAQTPESEVHGELIRHLLERGPALRSRLILVVDASGYRRRLAGTQVEDRRLEERREAWNRMATPLGLTPLHLDLGEGTAP